MFRPQVLPKDIPTVKLCLA